MRRRIRRPSTLPHHEFRCAPQQNSPSIGSYGSKASDRRTRRARAMSAVPPIAPELVPRGSPSLGATLPLLSPCCQALPPAPTAPRTRPSPHLGQSPPCACVLSPTVIPRTPNPPAVLGMQPWQQVTALDVEQHSRTIRMTTDCFEQQRSELDSAPYNSTAARGEPDPSPPAMDRPRLARVRIRPLTTYCDEERRCCGVSGQLDHVAAASPTFSALQPRVC